MKLLIISQYFYPEQFRVSDVSFKLAAMGNDVTVLTGLPNYPAGEIFDGYQWQSFVERSFKDGLYANYEIINGVKVIRCNLTPRKSGKYNLFRNYLSFLYQASKTAARMARFNASDYDKILVFQYSPVTMAIPGILLKKKTKKPLIVYCFDLWPESIVSAGFPNHGLIYQGLSIISKWIYKNADTLLVSSQSFRKYFKDKLGLNSSIQYLPIYAEDLFSQNNPASAPDKEKLTESSIDLVFAGNIGEMQSMDTIIRAAGLLREDRRIRFHIVGDGSALDKSTKLAKELKLNNVIFHGRHSLEEMPKYYNMADAFLVTLKKDPFISYTLPGKVQSYMAAGKPILAAIDGEAYQVIQSAGCGLCCPAEDFKSLARIIQAFADDKNSHRIYGDHSKSYYDEHYSEKMFFNALSDILDR